jgi:hypothetical protein
MTIETIEKNRKSFVKFRLFRKSFDYDFSCFNELLDFTKSSCLNQVPRETLIRLSLVMLFLENLLVLRSVIFITLV